MNKLEAECTNEVETRVESPCVCTKPFDAETSRNTDSDAPCNDGCN